MNTFCLFYQNRLLLKKVAEQYMLPTEADIEFLLADICTPQHTISLPTGETFIAASLTHEVDEEGKFLLTDLRAGYNLLPLSHYRAAGKAYEVLYWDTHSRFCPVCGTSTQWKERIMKKCPHCGHELYPPIATAIIVLIRRGEEVLLVRARNFRGKFYGLVAGFLEPGETLEECVEREVLEETGLRIKNIRYFGSQPWPYPCGLMVGFMADYAEGEIILQEEELATAAFFDRRHLPELPHKLSIARQLIDAWLEGRC